MTGRAVPEFRARDAGRALLLTTRPLVTADYSIELQRMSSAVLPPLFRRWYLISIVLCAETAIERQSRGRRHAARFLRGDASLRSPGGFEGVVWHEAIDALHLHVSPARMMATARFRAGADDIAPRAAVRLQDSTIAEIGHELRAAMRLELHARRRAADPLVAELLEHLVAQRGEQRAWAGRETAAALLEPVFELIHRNPGDRLTANRLSAAAGLAPFTFLRRFLMVTGLTPHHYLLRTRFERAKYLLSGGDTIAAVAAACGFSDQSHLTRVFRTLGATTPGRFRAAAQESSRNTPPPELLW
jgi:AraC family transcriptional regulator